jgi:hypothetical protein
MDFETSVFTITYLTIAWPHCLAKKRPSVLPMRTDPKGQKITSVQIYHPAASAETND